MGRRNDGGETVTFFDASFTCTYSLKTIRIRFGFWFVARYSGIVASNTGGMLSFGPPSGPCATLAQRPENNATVTVPIII
jgi:hypothetical protein